MKIERGRIDEHGGQDERAIARERAVLHEKRGEGGDVGKRARQFTGSLVHPVERKRSEMNATLNGHGITVGHPSEDQRVRYTPGSGHRSQG